MIINDINPIKLDLNLKESKTNFNQLKAQFDVFSGVENIHNFQHLYMPIIEKFTDNIDLLFRDNQDVKNCVI